MVLTAVAALLPLDRWYVPEGVWTTTVPLVAWAESAVAVAEVPMNEVDAIVVRSKMVEVEDAKAISSDPVSVEVDGMTSRLGTTKTDVSITMSRAVDVPGNVLKAIVVESDSCITTSMAVEVDAWVTTSRIFDVSDSVRSSSMVKVDVRVLTSRTEGAGRHCHTIERC